MKALWSVIPLPWKIGIFAALLGAIVAAYGFWRHSIWQDGYDARVAEEKAVAQKAQAVIVKTEKAYEKTLKDIQNAPDSGVSVGPLTAGAIDRLP